MPTIGDVARLAGVGTTTVTRVLAGRPHVSPATRARVEEAIAALDYHPNHLGRTLRTGVTRVIGVITPAPSTHLLSHVFFTSVLSAIGECAADHDYDVLWITAAQADLKGSYAYLHKSRKVDGIIDLCIVQRDPHVEALRVGDCPFVLIGHPDDDSLPHVDVANRAAGEAVGRAFAARHYSPIAFLGLANSPASRDRLVGLRDGLAETGLEVRPHHVALMTAAQDYENLAAFGEATARRWWAGGAWPRAVFAFTDEVACGVLRACRDGGLRVPDDVALVGFDDAPLSRLLDPPLASVQQPLRDLGYQAAELLLGLLHGDRNLATCRTLPARLVERESLGPLPSRTVPSGA